ncbi:hypothetical protein [Streptomyces sp. NPDC058466]|uniref:hypothetical protein n=1 Tax=Streptomyces sp. NPDC058466 TaxID=3346512 RepID=UPI0036588431
MPENDDSIRTEVRNQPIIFRNRPRPVPPVNDTTWRISALILLLGHFRGAAADADHLHILMHALRTPTTRSRFVAWWEGSFHVGVGSFNLEPTLDTTIKLTCAEGLASVSPKGRIQLLESGKTFYRILIGREEIFTEEKEFLAQLIPLSTAKLNRAMALIR